MILRLGTEPMGGPGGAIAHGFPHACAMGSLDF
jgi:hypothetical protein